MSSKSYNSNASEVNRSNADNQSENGQLQDNFRLYVAEGDQSFRRNQFSKAVSAYTRALNIQFDRAVLLHRSRCYIHLGKAEEAIADADAAISDLKKVTNNETKANTFHTKADALYSYGDFEFALVFYYLALRSASNILTVRSRFEQYRLGIQRAENGILRGIRSTTSLCIAKVVEEVHKEMGELMKNIYTNPEDKKCTARDLGIDEDDTVEELVGQEKTEDILEEKINIGDNDIEKQNSIEIAESNTVDSSFNERKENQFQMHYIESKADLGTSESSKLLTASNQSCEASASPNLQLDICNKQSIRKFNEMNNDILNEHTVEEDINICDSENPKDGNIENNELTDEKNNYKLPNQLQKMMYDMYGIDFAKSFAKGSVIFKQDNISSLIAKIYNENSTKNETEKEMHIITLCPLCACPGCDSGICSDELLKDHILPNEQIKDLIYDGICDNNDCNVSHTQNSNNTNSNTCSRLQNYFHSLGMKKTGISEKNKSLTDTTTLQTPVVTGILERTVQQELQQDENIEDEVQVQKYTNKLFSQLNPKTQQTIEKIVDDILTAGICKCRCPACLRHIAYTYGFILAPDGVTLIDAKEASEERIVLASDILETRVTELVLSGVLSNSFLTQTAQKELGTGKISATGRRSRASGTKSSTGGSNSSISSQTPQFLSEDAEFLNNLKNDNQLKESIAGQKLSSTIEEGLQYINKRTAFWSQQGFYQGSTPLNEIATSNQSADNMSATSKNKLNERNNTSSLSKKKNATSGKGSSSQLKQGNASGRNSSTGFSPSLSTCQTTVWRRIKDLNSNVDTLSKLFTEIKKQSISLHNIASKGVYGSDAVGSGSIAQSNNVLLKNCSDAEYSINQSISCCTKLNQALDAEQEQWNSIYGKVQNYDESIMEQYSKRIELCNNACNLIEKALKLSSDVFIFTGVILTERQKYSVAIQKFRCSAAIYSTFVENHDSNNTENNITQEVTETCDDDKISKIREESKAKITKIHSYAVTRALMDAANIHQLINSYQDSIGCYNKILSVIDRNKEVFPSLYKANILLKSTRCMLFINQTKDENNKNDDDNKQLAECKENIINALKTVFNDSRLYDNFEKWIRDENVCLPKFSVKDYTSSQDSNNISRDEAEILDLESIVEALFGLKITDKKNTRFNDFDEVAKYEKEIEDEAEIKKKEQEIIEKAENDNDALPIIQLSLSQQKRRQEKELEKQNNEIEGEKEQIYCEGQIEIKLNQIEQAKTDKERNEIISSIFMNFENKVLTAKDEEYLKFNKEIPQYKCNKSVGSGQQSGSVETVTSRELICDAICLLARVMFQNDEDDEIVLHSLALCEMLAKRWQDNTALSATYLNLRVVYSDIIAQFSLLGDNIKDEEKKQMQNAIELEQQFRQKCLEFQTKNKK